MMRFGQIATFLLTAFIFDPAFADETVGTRDITIHSPARNKELSLTLWYPYSGRGEMIAVGDNRIFEGAPAVKNATLPSEKKPLILLSHGSGSRGVGMAWIATRLAKEGYIVAAPDHPGTTSGDSTPEATPKIWERTDDLSTIITSLTLDPATSKSIDAKRIGVLGFSLGGSTALELVGARANLDAYVQYCVDYATSMDCQWFIGGKGFKNDLPISVPRLDLRTVDKTRFEQSNRDIRISAAVLVDPGLEVAFTRESLATIDVPLAFINLGSVGKIPVSVLSDSLAKNVNGATYAQVDHADHFSFLPVCRPEAADFLKSVGEIDPICEPAGPRDRTDIHKELEELIVGAFRNFLKIN